MTQFFVNEREPLIEHNMLLVKNCCNIRSTYRQQGDGYSAGRSWLWLACRRWAKISVVIRIQKLRRRWNGWTSNWPLAPAMLIVVLFPITCAATIVRASHCVGLTFPGMILLPGSFSGRLSSPNPQRGPEPRYRMSFAIFIREQASTLSAPWASTRASCVAKASN